MLTIASALVAALAIQTVVASDDDYPKACTPVDKSTYDFIIVGGGTAGSVLASRLSEVPYVKVLVIEAGGYPSADSEKPGSFAALPQSIFDYNFTSVDDKYTAQNLKGSSVRLTQGRVLGGTSQLNHMMYAQGNSRDFAQWAAINGDDTWNRTKIQRYYWRIEQLLDGVIQNSSYTEYHGKSGYLKIARDTSTSPILEDYLNAFAEVGQPTKVDMSGNVSLGYCEPLYTISDGLRQSNALVYLGPAKERADLCISLHSTATKILTSNGTATGVEMVDAKGNTIEVFARKEVIVSAGAINSPKLLLLSGIGPESDLKELGKEVVANLPVGENFQDHTATILMYEMGDNTDTVQDTDLGKFPAATIVGYVAIDPTQDYPDYQTVNLVLPHDWAALEKLCADVFSLNDDICQRFVEASKNKTTLLVVLYLLKPKSRGKVSLKSLDYKDAPAINMGTYSDSSDLELMAKSLKHFNQVINSKYFTSVNASMVDVGGCSDAKTEDEYFECYALAMSTTAWHYGGTCAMGTVLDSAMRVRGVNSLRVIDSSAIPILTSGKLTGPVTMLAEKGSDELFYTWQGQLGK